MFYVSSSYEGNFKLFKLFELILYTVLFRLFRIFGKITVLVDLIMSHYFVLCFLCLYFDSQLPTMLLIYI